mgnify:CR=1 FL=1
MAFLCPVSSLSLPRRVRSARFTWLTSRAVGRCFRGPFEEQALRTPFSSQPDPFWFKSPLLAFRTPLQPKLMRNVAWQLVHLSVLVPSPGARPGLQGFAGRLRINISCDVLIRSLSYTWRRLQRFRKLSDSAAQLARRCRACLPQASKVPFYVLRFPGYVLARRCSHSASLESAR